MDHLYIKDQSHPELSLIFPYLPNGNPFYNPYSQPCASTIHLLTSPPPAASD